MIDDTYNVQLIEVNSNPCLEFPCLLLNRIISEMIENVIRFLNYNRIAVDPIFPPPEAYIFNLIL